MKKLLLIIMAAGIAAPLTGMGQMSLMNDARKVVRREIKNQLYRSANAKDPNWELNIEKKFGELNKRIDGILYKTLVNNNGSNYKGIDLGLVKFALIQSTIDLEQLKQDLEQKIPAPKQPGEHPLKRFSRSSSGFNR